MGICGASANKKVDNESNLKSGDKGNKGIKNSNVSTKRGSQLFTDKSGQEIPHTGLVPGTEFTLLHFNDVYEIRENSKNTICGGVSRFDTLVKQYPDAIVLFSGDLWNPSKLSTEYLGRQN